MVVIPNSLYINSFSKATELLIPWPLISNAPLVLSDLAIINCSVNGLGKAIVNSDITPSFTI